MVSKGAACFLVYYALFMHECKGHIKLHANSPSITQNTLHLNADERLGLFANSKRPIVAIPGPLDFRNVLLSN